MAAVAASGAAQTGPLAATVSSNPEVASVAQLQADALPQIELSERVPARWLHNNPAEYPLRPVRWRRRMPRECRTQGGYREHCSGERRVPEPAGEAARVAQKLGLGHRWTARLMMHQRPLDEWLAAVEHLGRRRRMNFPVPGGHLGRGFGNTRNGSLRNRRHKGIDIGAPEGAPIVAVRDGLVMYSDNELTGYGNVVILLHREGYSTLYAHCQSTSVFAGQVVQRGQVIAAVGETGFAWAPHLHFEWRQRGWPRDPAPWLLPDE